MVPLARQGLSFLLFMSASSSLATPLLPLPTVLPSMTSSDKEDAATPIRVVASIFSWLLAVWRFYKLVTENTDHFVNRLRPCLILFFYLYIHIWKLAMDLVFLHNVQPFCKSSNFSE